VRTRKAGNRVRQGREWEIEGKEETKGSISEGEVKSEKVVKR